VYISQNVCSESIELLIDYNREKLLNAIVFFVKKTNYCGTTKLFKLLYYLDFLHFRETGRSVTGLDYSALPYGPVPCSLFDELKQMPDDLSDIITVDKPDKFNIIRAKKQFNDLHFSKRELRILNDVVYIFKDARADDMIEASHLPNHPWDKTIKIKGKNQKIDYLLAIDNSPDSLSIEEIQERIKDRKEIEQIFNE